MAKDLLTQPAFADIKQLIAAEVRRAELDIRYRDLRAFVAERRVGIDFGASGRDQQLRAISDQISQLEQRLNRQLDRRHEPPSPS